MLNGWMSKWSLLEQLLVLCRHQAGVDVKVLSEDLAKAYIPRHRGSVGYDEIHIGTHPFG